MFGSLVNQALKTSVALKRQRFEIFKTEYTTIKIRTQLTTIEKSILLVTFWI
jgi:hypothetical protein